MINDLLDLITDANILVICTEHPESVVTLLNTNNYHKVHCSNNLQTAMEEYIASPPDLIIVKPSANLTLQKLSDKLKYWNSDVPLPPVFLISDSSN